MDRRGGHINSRLDHSTKFLLKLLHTNRICYAKIPDHPWKMSATWTLKACEPNHPNWASTSMDCEGVLSTTVVSWLSFPPTLALRTTSFLVSGATLRGLRGLLSSQSARTGSGIPLPARQWHLKDQKVRVLNGRNPQVLGLSSWSFARV